MLHFHYVGHFDPRDFLDMSERPCRPKVRRPICQDAVAKQLAVADPAVAEYVWYDDSGYVGCSWAQAPFSLWETIHRFAEALAESESAVVMNEPPGWLITYPEDARKAQEEFWASGPAEPSDRPSDVTKK